MTKPAQHFPPSTFFCQLGYFLSWREPCHRGGGFQPARTCFPATQVARAKEFSAIFFGKICPKVVKNGTFEGFSGGGFKALTKNGTKSSRTLLVCFGYGMGHAALEWPRRPSTHSGGASCHFRRTFFSPTSMEGELCLCSPSFLQKAFRMAVWRCDSGLFAGRPHSPFDRPPSKILFSKKKHWVKR